jgi:hypothetical protein
MGSTPIASGAGLRHVRLYETDANGIPDGDQSGSDGYGGIRMQGVKSFNANIPDVQTIRHSGDDRVFAQDSLPPTEMETATLTTGKTNLTLDAVLSNVLVRTFGDGKMIGRGTDQQGFEPSFVVLAFRQAVGTDEDDDDTAGTRQYINTIYNLSRVVPKGSNMAEGTADENSYNMTPTPRSQSPWGEAFDVDVDGYETAIKQVLILENPVMIERFTGNGAIVTFNTQQKPISVAKTTVYVNGVLATVSSVNPTARTLTLSVAPANNAKVVAIYEASDMA